MTTSELVHYHEGCDPKLTVLNYSGGKQSSCLLWMLILGDLPRPKNLIVVNADPGMENSHTYSYNEMMEEQCQKAGIEYITAEGPNLYEDMLNLPNTDATRFDNPPYWTKGRSDDVGQLSQCCTGVYKIAPMDRVVRMVLERDFGISVKSKRLGNDIVEKWIGFSYDEQVRIKPARQKYVYFRFPLVDLQMDSAKVMGYYLKNKLPVPPRSVCNACFANGLESLKEMHDERPDDWKQAVAVDEAIRDWTQIGVEEEVFVSRTLTPLKDLPDLNFYRDRAKQTEFPFGMMSCDSGYCFT